jgi:hypothetical protein
MSVVFVLLRLVKPDGVVVEFNSAGEALVLTDVTGFVGTLGGTVSCVWPVAGELTAAGSLGSSDGLLERVSFASLLWADPSCDCALPAADEDVNAPPELATLVFGTDVATVDGVDPAEPGVVGGASADAVCGFPPIGAPEPAAGGPTADDPDTDFDEVLELSSASATAGTAATAATTPITPANAPTRPM